MNYKIAVVGATGLVGSVLVNLLKSFKKIENISFFASKNSIAKKIDFNNQLIEVLELNLEKLKNFDVIFFAAGSKISKEYIPQIDKKTLCIDLSSYFREDKKIPLIIPEINGHALLKKHNIIASPNCTTTIMLLPIFNLHKKYKIRKILASTYQAASGGGKKLIDKLFADTAHLLKTNERTSYGLNLYLHDSLLNDQKYSLEEVKMINETRKILNTKSIKVNATCVRVPVVRCHSISLNVEFKNPFIFEEAYETIKNTENVVILEDFQNNKFATPNDAFEKNEVFVSRIRQDITNKNALDMFIVSDQLLKGAAFNAFQIFEYYTSKFKS
ncbi:MAG: hypothetical protein A2888_01070 [Chlamydiae bacterium RIFCSPLOWO2_01_FULL_28_7]|nr:MAG: hypothetical protein A2888_01070 [Chlamydiae bacterium RIFCSPLOWO2_01_FULL_28_7]